MRHDASSAAHAAGADPVPRLARPRVSPSEDPPLSPLTKAFVILVTILSILLVALVIPYVANTDDLQGQIGELEAEVQSANAAAKVAAQDAADLRQNQAADDKQLQQRLTELLAENTDLRNQVNATQGDYAKSQDRIDSLTASQQIVNESLNRTAELLQSRTSLLEESQGSNVQLNRQIAELVTANSDFAAQVDGLTQTNRILQEQLAEANRQLTTLAEGRQQSGGDGGPGGGQGAAGGSVNVQGSVTAVEEVGGIKLVQLNIGRNDNITENTRVALYRGSGNNTLVGLAEIRSVDDNVSVGQMLNEQRAPQAGDSATTDF